jgi:hypothetical protein
MKNTKEIFHAHVDKNMQPDGNHENAGHSWPMEILRLHVKREDIGENLLGRTLKTGHLKPF